MGGLHLAKKTLTLGKYYALQRCSTASGKFAILAIDHQDALRQRLRPSDPNSLSAKEMTQFKLAVVERLASEVSGVLLDPVYGAGQAIAKNALHRAGLLIELEKADYQMEPMPMEVEIDPDWSVEKIKRMGADGVKLFFYYNPSDTVHAQRQDAIVRRVVDDCQRFDIPFYAEPIFYPVPGGDSKRSAVIKSARHVAVAGADVLKLEFPADPQVDQDEGAWEDACAEITASVDVPWVLLGAGVSYDTFTRQLEVACKAGASGFIVGRAVWGDAAAVDEDRDRNEWLDSEGCKRLRTLGDIVEKYARAWRDWYEAPAVTSEWFKQYASQK